MTGLKKTVRVSGRLNIMDRPHHPDLPHLRVSDPERHDAINILGSHFAEGRLSLDEFEQRSTQAANAVTKSELDTLFKDLPPLSPGAHLMPHYSAAEIERARRDGARPKASILGMTAVGATAAAIVLNPIWDASFALLLMIPAIAILLYVAKVGPDHWHTPSQRSMERRRLKAIRVEQRLEIEQRKAQRRTQRAQLTDSAMKFATNSINKKLGDQR